jgi:glycerophosphoryl diester phosphodiesterase
MMRPLPALISTLLLLVGLLFQPATQAQTVIDLQGHRGARGLLPENSLPGFELALKLGVRTLELDVLVTEDDELVISHDPNLNPDITRDARGQFLTDRGPDIRSLRWQALRAYDVGRIKPGTRYASTFAEQQPVDGTRIPRLRDLFDLLQRQGHDRVRLAIETKITPHQPWQTPEPARFVALLLALVEAYELGDRVQILSFDWRTLQEVQRQRPGTPTVYLTAQLPVLDNLQFKAAEGSPWTAGFQLTQHGSVPRMIKAAGGTHWSSFWRELNAENVREARQLGLKVLAWTVNERAQIERMLDLGVDGIVTDRPDIAIEVLKARKLSW